MNTPKVIMICGSTGAGKSTYAKKLAYEINAMNFSIDEWMKTLFWMDAPIQPSFDWAIDKVNRCETLIWRQTKEAVDLGNNVILDLGFSETKQRNKFYQLLRDNSIAYELHFLEVSAEIRWQRVVDTNKALDHTSISVSKETFEWMETYFQEPTDVELLKNSGQII